MYVLVSPCIPDPSLRARGITSDQDREFFRAAVERCRKFGIGVVPLPCPEMLYLGKDREPGTFLERLNTPEFAGLQEKLLADVRATIARRGPPACIIGVDSSPACGVTATYYGAAGSEPPKRPGRGTFLAGLADIPAIDVKTFARYRVYLAAPLFSEAEREYNRNLAELLALHWYEVFLPQEAGDDSHDRGMDEHQRIFTRNVAAIRNADIVVAVIDGADADSGTAWEMGFACAMGKPVFAIRTDFRMAGVHERVNLMLEQSAAVAESREELLDLLGAPAQDTGCTLGKKVPDFK